MTFKSRIFENEQPTANSQQPTANSQQPTANSQQPTANSQQPTANSQQPTANSQQPTANSQQPTANSQQPTANSQQPTANSQQPTANSQQPTAYYLDATIKVTINASGYSLIVTPTPVYLSPCKKFAHLWNIPAESSQECIDVKTIKLIEKSFLVKNINNNICQCANLSTLTNQKLKLGFSFNSSNNYTLVEVQVG